MDVVVVCYGVNDLFQSGDEEQIKRDLSEIVSKLQSAGTKVVIQTIPPFDYSGILIEKWNHINQYIVQVLSKRADGVFDVVPVLAKDDGHPYLAKFGGHPNAEGCGAWAEALYPVMDKFLATISC
ncbi:MAG: SGNH/GDSL hydrolase family protein [Clostridia bacterium]